MQDAQHQEVLGRGRTRRGFTEGFLHHNHSIQEYHRSFDCPFVSHYQRNPRANLVRGSSALATEILSELADLPSTLAVQDSDDQSL